ncbi:hypothetical protein ANO14919_142800 [Xylariales sp. No.14919]|nr:hypothetical protein ANO14919_142800 [Xylariales sp. No.14919]
MVIPYRVNAENRLPNVENEKNHPIVIAILNRRDETRQDIHIGNCYAFRYVKTMRSDLTEHFGIDTAIRIEVSLCLLFLTRPRQCWMWNKQPGS